MIFIEMLKFTINLIRLYSNLDYNDLILLQYNTKLTTLTTKGLSQKQVIAYHRLFPKDSNFVTALHCMDGNACASPFQTHQIFHFIIIQTMHKNGAKRHMWPLHINFGGQKKVLGVYILCIVKDLQFLTFCKIFLFERDIKQGINDKKQWGGIWEQTSNALDSQQNLKAEMYFELANTAHSFCL